MGDPDGQAGFGVTPEEWRTVDGTDGFYEVSDRGRVRTWRKGKWGRASAPRVLSPGPDGAHGHLAVNLCLGNGVRRRGKVHRLVALAFLGAPPPGTEVRHLDGNPKNNDLSNLAYGTRRENVADADAHGTLQRGSAKSTAKLKEADVPTIRSLRRSGWTQQEVGAVFGVSRELISRIDRRVRWTHVVD